jgi:hypothetical protein
MANKTKAVLAVFDERVNRWIDGTDERDLLVRPAFACSSQEDSLPRTLFLYLFR